MRRLISIAFLSLLIQAVPVAGRAAPVELGFSARLADSGIPVNGTRTLVVSLYDVATGGMPLWTETHVAAPITDGVVNLVLGSGTALDDALLNGAALHLELTVQTTTLSPRLEVLPVPYAVRASKAGSALTCAAADLLGTLGPTDVQRRVSGACQPGWSIRSIDAAGAVICEADDGLTAVSVGAGLAGAGTVGSPLGIQSGSITSAMIADGTIVAGDIANDAIGAGQIATGGVGAAELATGAVGSLAIADGGVGAADLAVGAVGAAAIADGAVGAAEIAAGAVGSAKLADGAVGNAKIATGAVTNSRLALAVSEYSAVSGGSLSVTTVSAHQFCALTGVGWYGSSSNTIGCSVVRNVSGTWTVSRTVQAGTGISCTMTCF